MKLFLYGCSIFWVCSCIVVQAAMTSNSGYTIWSDAFSSGGSEGASSTNFNVSDTIGEQSMYGSSTSNYTGGFGFRYLSNDALTLNLSSNSLSLGTLSKTATQSASHSMTVQSNSSSGISVTVSGNTLESGAGSITEIGAVPAAATVGSSQFGLNVIYSGGSAPTATAQPPYDTAGLYAYTSGSEIISSSGVINATTFTINYIANISGSEPPGSYSTTLTYTATANF